MTILTTPKVLREKLGEDGVDALVDLVNKAMRNRKKMFWFFVEERFEGKLAEVKADLIKWMFIFWASQIGLITGLLFAFRG